jgi:hypothetical protein
MSFGIVYAATGARCILEALRSARSLRRHMPDVPVCLMTDRPVRSPLLTDVLVDRSLGETRRPKLHLDRAPYTKVLYLDADTYVAGDLGPVFDLLEHFDFAAQQYSSGYHYTLPGVPNTFPEFNSGVLAFRRTAAVTRFFADWRAAHAELGQPVDQPSLRLALFRSTLRVASLPPEYNFLPYFPHYATDRVRVLHGRPHGALVALEREMNRKVCYRFYSPGLGCVPVRDAMGPGDMARLVGRALAVSATMAVKRPLRALRRRRGGTG